MFFIFIIHSYLFNEAVIITKRLSLLADICLLLQYKKETITLSRYGDLK
jgi:hypothetical protein